MQQRYYDPIAGRFLSVDPVVTDARTGGGFGRYHYGSNNPYRYTDPDGQAEIDETHLGRARGAGGVGELGGGWAGPPSRTTRTIADARANLAEARAEAAAKNDIQANKAKGDAFQKQVTEQLQQTQKGVVQEVTVKTEQGVRTCLDIMGREADGTIAYTECKGSAIAPLTTNQTTAFPQIKESGATVVGKGKPGFLGGTKIPPTEVKIVRPK